ncbi:MAG TPA: hypothetical protein VN622_08945 [Clostridia bacterium]|nr:hypothetical protein [Clostridia bacterium]
MSEQERPLAFHIPELGVWICPICEYCGDSEKEVNEHVCRPHLGEQAIAEQPSAEQGASIPPTPNIVQSATECVTELAAIGFKIAPVEYRNIVARHIAAHSAALQQERDWWKEKAGWPLICNACGQRTPIAFHQCHTCKDKRDNAEQRITNLEEERRWIYVAERLPKERQEVEVCLVDDNRADGGECYVYAAMWRYEPSHRYWKGVINGHGIRAWREIGPLPSAPSN